MTAHTHDGTRTWRTGRQATTLLALLAGVFGGAASCAAPIQADMMGNAFLTALTNAGIAYDQPATTVALGRSVGLSDGGCAGRDVRIDHVQNG